MTTNKPSSTELDTRSSLHSSIYTNCDPELRSVLDKFSFNIVDFSSNYICFSWSTSDLSLFLAIETLIMYVPYLDEAVSKTFDHPVEIVFQPSIC